MSSVSMPSGQSGLPVYVLAGHTLGHAIHTIGLRLPMRLRTFQNQPSAVKHVATLISSYFCVLCLLFLQRIREQLRHLNT